MIITLTRGQLLEALFAEAPASDEDLIQFLRQRYAIGVYIPEAKVEGDLIHIQIDEAEVDRMNEEYQRIVRLAEKGKYDEAKRLIADVIAKGTAHSDVYRIYGQILFDQSAFEEALDQFLDALRWNPENVSALIMVGNLYAKHKRDIETAKVFFEQALTLDPDHVTALTNFGSVLAEVGRTRDARRYFERALELQPDYPQAHLGMAIVSEAGGDLVLAFDHDIQALKQVQERSPFQSFLQDEARRIAESYASSFDRDTFLAPILKSLAERSGKPVRIVEDPSIPTPARIEIAEHRGASEHIVRYKAVSPTLPHYVLHELMHLDLVLEARAVGRNKQFVSNDDHREQFMVDAAPMLPIMKREGLPSENAQKFLHSLFVGINSQVYNAPIDLSIESEIHRRFPVMRPIQFLSLLEMQETAIQGANLDHVKRIAPPLVYTANVTMSLTHAMQIRDMYGFDETSKFSAKNLIKRATGLYTKWQTKQAAWEAGDEYELIESWGRTLGLSGYFVLRDEQKVSATPLDTVLQQILDDPYDQRDELKNKEPWDKGTDPSIRMDVVSYCVDALKFIQGLSDDQIQEVGFELAMVGRQGFDTTTRVKRYRFAGIPERSFSGLEAIAWMYCFWKRIDPSVDVGADLGREYALARHSENNSKCDSN
jgi:tetratricopeptide (TPR) repeat protein